MKYTLAEYNHLILQAAFVTDFWSLKLNFVSKTDAKVEYNGCICIGRHADVRAIASTHIIIYTGK